MKKSKAFSPCSYCFQVHLLRYSDIDGMLFRFFDHIGEDICRLCICIGQVVQIFLRSLDLGVSEPCLYLSDVYSAKPEKCRKPK